MTRRWRMVAAIVGVAASVSLNEASTVSWSGTADPQGQPDVVDVTAERFSFTPSEIRVKAGTRLQIRLSSEDTDHGFRIPGTDIDVRIPKRHRGTTTVTFEAEKPGRYMFQCSHVCGAGHSFMRGEIVVTE